MQNKFDSALICIDFRHYWHVGSGMGSGYHLDAICARDENGLPFLSGRQLKGILRQAVSRAESWGWFKDIPIPEGYFKEHEKILFGSTNQDVDKNETQPGILVIGNAHMPNEEAAYLASEAELKQSLFAELFSTAIDEKTGTAKKYSLRGKEVTIPLCLQAEAKQQITAVHLELQKQQIAYIASGHAWQILTLAQSLIDSLGANKTRGLGEAVVNISPYVQAISKECN